MNNQSLPSAFSNDGNIRYYSFARYAFMEALLLAGIGLGKTVLLPSYLCRDLLSPLNLLGAIPCWYDISTDLSPKSTPDTWPQADAVLVVNYFGFSQNLHPFEVYKNRTGAVLIEDNAHGYLSQDNEGRWLGCRTGLGIFSFRKTLRIPDGAALWARHSNGYAKALPAQLTFNGSGIHFAQLVKYHMRKIPLIGETVFRISVGLVRIIRGFRSYSTESMRSPLDEQEILAMPNPWSGLLKSLASCNIARERKRRRALYLQFQIQGEKVGVIPVFENLPPFCVPYAFAFRGNPRAISKMKKYAKQEGFDLVGWPDLPNCVVENAPIHYRDVFLINFIW